MQTLEATEVIKKIEIENKTKATQDIRVIKKVEVGKSTRQGDVYIHFVKDCHERGKEINDRQLAPGSSKGSRHILSGKVKVFEGKKLPDYVDPKYPLGPLFTFEEGAVLTHPEHAHIRFDCKGTAQATYQIDMRTKKRTED